MSTKCEKLGARIGKVIAESNNAGEISQEEAMIAQCTLFAAIMSMHECDNDKFVQPDVETFKFFAENMRMFNPE